MGAANDELDFSALTEDDWRQREAQDDAAISQINNNYGDGEALNELISKVSGGDIDQRGKADDAIDFEDIDLSDEDDLPDEEEPSGTQGAHDVPGLTDDGGTSNDTDDLFGGDVPSSPLDGAHGGLRSSPDPLDADTDGRIHLAMPGSESMEDLRNLNFEHDEDQAQTNQDPNIPPPAENFIATVKQAFPGFEENVILNWNEVLRPKLATWISKKPARVPKPLIPSKLSLELGADQEKMFRIPGPASSSVYQRIKKRRGSRSGLS